MTDRRSESFSPQMLPSDPFADTPTLAERATPSPGSPVGAPPPRRMRGFNPNPFAFRVFAIKEVVVGYVSGASVHHPSTCRRAKAGVQDHELIVMFVMQLENERARQGDNGSRSKCFSQ